MSYDYRAAWTDKSIGELKSRIGFKTCGDCDKWMIHKQCPRETKPELRGFSRGPSLNSAACGDFKANVKFNAIEQVYIMKILES